MTHIFQFLRRNHALRREWVCESSFPLVHCTTHLDPWEAPCLKSYSHGNTGHSRTMPACARQVPPANGSFYVTKCQSNRFLSTSDVLNNWKTNLSVGTFYFSESKEVAVICVVVEMFDGVFQNRLQVWTICRYGMHTTNTGEIGFQYGGLTLTKNRKRDSINKWKRISYSWS